MIRRHASVYRRAYAHPTTRRKKHFPPLLHTSKHPCRASLLLCKGSRHAGRFFAAKRPARLQAPSQRRAVAATFLRKGTAALRKGTAARCDIGFLFPQVNTSAAGQVCSAAFPFSESTLQSRLSCCFCLRSQQSLLGRARRQKQTGQSNTYSYAAPTARAFTALLLFIHRAAAAEKQ